MSITETDTDIAIIGAGPTGLMLANLLGVSGIKTRLFERRRGPHSEPRAIAFDPETLRLFQTAGCYGDLEEALERDVPVAYLNAAGKTLARLDEVRSVYGHSSRGTFYQPEMEAALLRGLERFEHVALHRGVEVCDAVDREKHVDLIIRGDGKLKRSLSARYAIDCSGGGSRLRERLGVRFSGSTFKEKWLVVDTVGDEYPDREIQFFCDPKRPAVTLPVSKNRRRWEFLVMPGDDEARLAEEASARALMADYGAGRTEAIERSLVYTFHARIAERFKSGRILLAGDAAHVMPPFAGQGLNSGMRDAANLAWKLTAVCKGHMAPRILETYEPERRQHIEDMTRLAIKLGRAIMPTSGVRAWARDRAMLTAWRIPMHRRRVNRGDLIPDPSIASSSLVNWRRGASVGRMIEQPDIRTPDGESPLDALMGASFCALGVNCDVETTLYAEDKRLLEKLDTNFISISSGGADTFEHVEWNGVLKDLLRGRSAILIIRPDRFIIDILSPNSTEPRLSWLSSAYGVLRRENTAEEERIAA